MADHASGRAAAHIAATTPPPGLSPGEYLTDRLAQYQSWYDKKAIKAKAIHLRTRAAAVVGGSLVPVLVNLEFPNVQAVTTVVSLVVAGAVSLESVFRYREQWKNYRSTEQTLGHERMYFLTRTGVYTDLDDATAFATLVERVEATIANENAATLSVMTQVGFAGEDGQTAIERQGNRQ